MKDNSAMKEDADSCSLPLDEVYLNIRMSVITAQRQVSQTVPIWNALRSETGRMPCQNLIHILKETNHCFNGRSFNRRNGWTIHQSHLNVPIRDALRPEFIRICFRQYMQVSDAKTPGFHPEVFRKMCGGIL